MSPQAKADAHAKPNQSDFQPLPAATASAPYKCEEYYKFGLYSFAVLGGQQKSLRCPQPSNMQ